MPRPRVKRTKLNHPTPSKRVANASQVSPVVELQQKLVNKPIGRVLTDSDDSDRLVTSNRNGRNRRGIPRRDIYASGGVGLGDVPGAHTSQRKQSQTSRKAEAQEPTDKGKQAAQKNVNAVAKPTTYQKRSAQVVEKQNAPIQSPPTASGPASVSRTPTRLQATPGPETSILGNIKPRRRQPSILQLIENDDSSNIGEEDEDDFLPNDESTPLNHSAAQPTTSTPHSSSHQLISRKRKLSPPITLVPSSQVREEPSRPGKPNGSEAEHELDSEPELPPPSRSATAPLSPEPYDPDIMAPPLSSSPLKSPAKSIIHSPVKKMPSKSKNQPVAPSTNELRALMPSRKQRKGRLRSHPVSEFDIPADTNSENSDGGDSPEAGSDDDLSFRADIKGRNTKVTTQRKATAAKKPDNVRIRGRDKSTISPTKLVTPLKGPAAQKSAAKSSFSQLPGHASATAKEKATYSSRRRDTYGDKENQPVDLSRDFSGVEGSSEDGSFEQSIEKPEKQLMKEIETIAKKFADVDEWEMEFEDVSSGGDSSPNRR
jgi:hypothetical protein